jgi:hypothetical protein
MQYDPSCTGCDISRGIVTKVGGLLTLPGDWTANQYGGGEGFLGWLALQPRFHRMEFSDLSCVEAAALGPNIKALDRALRAYWDRQFVGDPVLRVYVVYFFESAFEDPKPSESYHLHIHIIPRFRSLEPALQAGQVQSKWPDGWRISTLAPTGQIPEAYNRQVPNWEERATALMDYLRSELAS